MLKQNQEGNLMGQSTAILVEYKPILFDIIDPVEYGLLHNLSVFNIVYISNSE